MNSFGVLCLIYAVFAIIPEIKDNGFHAAMRLNVTFGEILSFGLILIAAPLVFLAITKFSFSILKKSVAVLFYVGLCLALLAFLLPTLLLRETALTVLWWGIPALGVVLMLASSLIDRYFGS